jgi:hypothetical protein
MRPLLLTALVALSAIAQDPSPKDAVIVRLEARIAALEKRVAELEARLSSRAADDRDEPVLPRMLRISDTFGPPWTARFGIKVNGTVFLLGFLDVKHPMVRKFVKQLPDLGVHGVTSFVGIVVINGAGARPFRWGLEDSILLTVDGETVQPIRHATLDLMNASVEVLPGTRGEVGFFFREEIKEATVTGAELKLGLHRHKWIAEP